jgi:hypothetical protein
MENHWNSIERLHARFDVIAQGRQATGDSGAAHRAVLDRLTDNRSEAEKQGWVDVVLARLGGTGRLYLEGTPPSGIGRAVVPDWPTTSPSTP